MMAPLVERTSWISRHVTPHEPALRAWLRRRVVAGIDVDDIVQETYAVLAGLAGVDHIRSPRAYAFQTAHSIIRLYLRRARIVRFEPLDDTDLSVTAADTPSPEHQVAVRQELRRLERLIQALPQRRREAFILHKIEGLSQRDVAQRMGISESVVEKQIGRALRSLMDAVGRGDVQGAETLHGPGGLRMHGEARDKSTDRRLSGDLGCAIGPRGALA